MKFYFAGSIRGGRNDAELYQGIIQLLQEYGEVLTEHIADQSLTQEGQKNKTDEQIYTTDVAWINEADWIIAEVTQPSLGVGYELGYGEAHKKNTLCLYRPQSEKRLSAMITGNPKLNTIEYQTLDDLETIFKNYFNKK